jgi:hypothetical protein
MQSLCISIYAKKAFLQNNKQLKNRTLKNNLKFIWILNYLCSKFALKFFKRLFLSRKTEGIDPMTS